MSTDDERQECPCVMRSPADYDGPLEDCPTHGREADARRERYRLTVYRAIERGDDPADATMAVADEEILTLQRELTKAKAAHRAVWDKHQKRGQRIFDLQGENARLRAELEEADENDRRRGAELFEKNATIERVRSVLDAPATENGFPFEFGYNKALDDVRAALKGQSSE